MTMHDPAQDARSIDPRLSLRQPANTEDGCRVLAVAVLSVARGGDE